MTKQQVDRIRKPPIGESVWFVSEHRYYVAGRASPEFEFSVYCGEIIGYRMGRWTDVRIRYCCEDGCIRTTDIGLSVDAQKQKIFDNPRDAALVAREKTDAYLKRWGWVWDKWPDTPPMRRSWEQYVEQRGDGR